MDIGTGTDVIIALLHEYQNAKGTAIDVSDKAIAVAQENANRNKVFQRLSTKQCGWNDLGRDKKYNMIVSNPPYINRSDIPQMQREVLEHDPHLALFADDHGLKAYKELCGNRTRHPSKRDT